tara:strand:- start:430 stop:657 length:228 start_codon:yes stop_codon:yes gene_type:complete
MDKQIEQLVDLKKIESIKTAFDNSMKLLEKNIAESVTNNQKIQIMKEDMLEANKKFNKAEECLDSLKIKLNYLKK